MVLNGDIFSKYLPMEMGVSIIMPFDRQPRVHTEPCKVLYLLHGLSDNHSSWLRMTNIERYAHAYNLAVIMPEGHHSFYSNMVYGGKYFTYLTEELPKVLAATFQISTRREDTFIAGLSMGGYGALMCGLRRPDRYGGCAGFSSAADIRQMIADDLNRTISETLVPVFGEKLEVPPEGDLFALAEACALRPATEQPQIFMTCGRQDFLHPYNEKLAEWMLRLKLPVRFEEWDGQHEWGFWDRSIQLALQHFLG